MRLRSRTKGISRLIPIHQWGFRGSSLLFIFAGIVLFTLSAFNPSSMQSVRIAATDMLAPVLSTMNRPFQIAAGYVTTISGIAQLREENARLHEENARLREWHQTALTLKSENERLAALLKLRVPESHGFVTARVIADAGNTFAQSVLVLGGGLDGIEKGQAVLSGDGLIGRIVEAGNKASRVLLLTDINSRVPVIIEGSETRAILAGQNHSYPMLDHLPPDQQIPAGARVITSGHGGLFLPGLPVGQTFTDEQGRIFVQLYAGVDRLSYVRIIDKIIDRAILEGQIQAGPQSR